MRPLFFYGVLMPELASGRMAELVALLERGEPATTAARLFAVADPDGHHPAMVPGDGVVHGRVHRTGRAFGREELAEMDAYEGRHYRRCSIEATLADGCMLECEAYLWIEPADGLEPIAHGDFARYLRETGHPALPG